MLIPPRDISKMGTITCSQAIKNSILAQEIEETSQGPLKSVTWSVATETQSLT